MQAARPAGVTPPKREATQGCMLPRRHVRLCNCAARETRAPPEQANREVGGDARSQLLAGGMAPTLRQQGLSTKTRGTSTHGSSALWWWPACSPSYECIHHASAAREDLGISLLETC